MFPCKVKVQVLESEFPSASHPLVRCRSPGFKAKQCLVTVPEGDLTRIQSIAPEIITRLDQKVIVHSETTIPPGSIKLLLMEREDKSGKRHVNATVLPPKRVKIKREDGSLIVKFPSFTLNLGEDEARSLIRSVRTPSPDLPVTISESSLVFRAKGAELSLQLSHSDLQELIGNLSVFLV